MIRRIITIVLLIAILIVAFVFASFNTALINVDFLFASFELPQSVVMLGAVVVGIVIGLLCASLFLLRSMNQKRALKKSLRMAQTEVSSLRSLPLHDAD